MKSNIILIGMPGSGKSTAARIIAQKLSRPLFDSDGVFCEKYGRTPADVITSEGEEVFRDMESEVIAELGKKSGAVIACGGGVVTKERNYAPLHQNGVIVFLERALENLSLRPVSEEILALNEVSREYGLVLSEEDAKELRELIGQYTNVIVDDYYENDYVLFSGELDYKDERELRELLAERNKSVSGKKS